MGEEVILLDCWASRFCMRVKIALEGKGIKYECREENLLAKSPLLLQSNPVYKKVPVLIHKGKPICESLVILEYIDEVWKEKFPLFPSDPYQRAQARFWADFIDNKLCDCEKRIWMIKGENTAAAAGKDLIEILKQLEGELGEKPYFGGETMGLVDVTLVPHYSWFYTYEKFTNFNIEAECPKMIEWAKRCMKMDSVAKTLPDQHKLYDFVLIYKKDMGME